MTAIGTAVVVASVWRARGLPVVGTELETWPADLFTIVPFGLAAAVLLGRRPDLPFGWLFGAGLAAHVANVALHLPATIAVLEGSDAVWVRWALAASGLAFVQVPVHGVIYLRFPSGRPASTAGRVMEWVLVAGTALVVLGGLFGATNLRSGVELPAFQRLEHPLTADTRIGAIADGLVVLAPLVAALSVAAGIGVVIRFFRAEGIARQQLKWSATAVVLGLALFPLAVTDRATRLAGADNLVFVAAIAVAVLRYRLWSIDTIIRRSLGYGAVTAGLLALYALVTVVGTNVVSERAAGAVAAAAVALAFGPVRAWAQRMVDRLFYGERGDPYRTLSDLGRSLDQPADQAGLLTAAVGAVATSLRLPYIAIELGDGTTVAACGQAGDRAERWPLTYGGQIEGALVAAPRRGEDQLGERDRQVLADVARHAGVAVHAAAATAELLVSRQRLVTAREEERRRLRRELHDGLGPLLTSAGLNLDALRAQVGERAPDLDRLVAQTKEVTTTALAEVRRVVYGLRPPAIDDIGLIEAIRTQSGRLVAGSSTRISFQAGELPLLPAAVEVAAYRTAVEAVTNVVRHTTSGACRVALRVEGGDLVLEVADDGAGRDAWVAGVGLVGMRERAEELGGTLDAGPSDIGGAVVARFPIAVATS